MNICQNCYDDMHMVQEDDTLKFVCDSHCGYEDTEWQMVKEEQKESILSRGDKYGVLR